MTPEQLAALREVAEKRVEAERQNGPETTMAYSEYLKVADAFREEFTPTTCLALVRELERLKEIESEVLRIRNEIDTRNGYM
jgi:hypothetical protein